MALGGGVSCLRAARSVFSCSIAVDERGLCGHCLCCKVVCIGGALTLILSAPKELLHQSWVFLSVLSQACCLL
jgi:hypothetical protein